MKVLDQLVFFGELHGLQAREAKKRAADWAARMEIADALDKKTEELSKGMQQKIQFIGSVLHSPKLIVMDEPFSGLDPVNAVLLERTLIDLKDHGSAILFSTHRMDQVEKLCDSICLINNGEAVLAGRVREIKSRYERNQVIVEFEGSADFLRSDEIAEARNFSGHAEIRLKPRGDAQKLLHEAAAIATIYRFELVEPSLEEIFIRTVEAIPMHNIFLSPDANIRADPRPRLPHVHHWAARALCRHPRHRLPCQPGHGLQQALRYRFAKCRTRQRRPRPAPRS